MIRIGSSSTGVVSVFNSFHSTASQTSGFFTNSGVPPPRDKRWVGSDETLPSLLKPGTLHVDPYGIPEPLPVVFSSFYMQLTAASTELFNVSWSNAYSGTCRSVFPDGRWYKDVSFATDDIYYVRVNNVTRTYRLFITQLDTLALDVYLVGPQSISKVVEISAGKFKMDGLTFVEHAVLQFVKIRGTSSVEFQKAEQSTLIRDSNSFEYNLGGSFPTPVELIGISVFP